jgi:uncharacterized membrane protein YgdD (TMEM256/DUF423 family)
MIPKRKEVPSSPAVPQPPLICTNPIWKHVYSGSLFVRLAGVCGATAVALGAYGAHGRFIADKKLAVFSVTQCCYSFLKYMFATCNLYHKNPSVFTVIYPKEGREELRKIYETANRYHFLHSLALLGVPLCRWPRTASFWLLDLS